MKILYTAMKHDYGDPARGGDSFEQHNFHDSLVAMGYDLLHYDAVAGAKRLGPVKNTQRLREIVDAEKPDLLFSVLFTDELDRQIFRRISDETATTTINWFCDDHWRFDDYSADWAPYFNHVVTTAASAVPKYHALKDASAIKSQWAANPFTYRRDPDAEMRYDISFVGLPHGNRVAIVDVLKSAGLNVELFGLGWGHGRIDQARMIEVFNTSRINLNLSNSSTVQGRRHRPADIEADPRLHRLAGLPRVGRYAAGVYRRARRIEQRFFPPRPESALKPSDIDLGPAQQIKGRNFEVPGCGGFLLSGEADNLADYYQPGREIETFATLDQLIEKARHYLSHDDSRREVADAGWRRTQHEHTWCHRFHHVFTAAGFDMPQVQQLLKADHPGTSTAIT